MTKRRITLCVLLIAIIIPLGWNLKNQISENRLNRYQACTKQKIKIINNMSKYMEIKAGEDEYFFQQLKPLSPNIRGIIKLQRSQSLRESILRERADFVNSESTTHPCKWLKDYHEVLLRTSSDMGTASW